MCIQTLQSKQIYYDRLASWEKHLEIHSPEGVEFRMKLETAYIHLFTSPSFLHDALVGEIYRKDHNRLWYTTSSSFYPTEVANFYERVQLDPDAWELKIQYGNNVHTIKRR